MKTGTTPVGKSIPRVDAADKVTGRTKYTADLIPRGALTARVLHATIANGIVKSIRTEAALALPGVEKVVTCFDVPDIQFTTSGNPWTTDEAWQDIRDRKLLNRRVRYYGDDIAAVIAKDELTARKALALLEVEYETYPACFDVLEALENPGIPVHDEYPDNLMGFNELSEGDYDAVTGEPGLICVDRWYEVPPVKHCHIENPVSCAYMERDKIVVVASTQMPHVLRREIGQALGIPWGRVRVIRPAMGGGFGNKDDALYEPLNAFLSMQVGGRPVKLELTREEDFASTRTRHGMKFHLITHVRKDGTIAARYMDSYSNQGAYASHGHAIASKGTLAFSMIYKCDAFRCRAYTVYTNLPCAGAMRGYGMPQITFAMEAHTDDLARAVGMDPVEFRRLNMMEQGFTSKDGVLTNYYDSLNQCLDRASEYMKERREKKQRGAEEDVSGVRSTEENVSGARCAAEDKSGIRRGTGCAVFWYKTAVAPICLEASTMRILLTQDGSFILHTGEVDLGQGADTVLVQMAAERLHTSVGHVRIVSEKDTDITPYGQGAYASRTTYVGGMAVAKAAETMCGKLLARAAQMLGCTPEELYLCDSCVCRCTDDAKLLTYEAVAMESAYSREHAEHLIAEETANCHTNALSLGCCMAEVEVDIRTGRVQVTDIVNAHDCGIVINPALAEGQVHGGVSMGLGYGLAEEMKFDPVTGRLQNDNLLDYKLLTAMDHPSAIGACFVENPEPTGAFGTKALGEPPCVPTAPAIRNAVLDATGAAIDTLPLSPALCLKAFRNMREAEGNSGVRTDIKEGSDISR